MSIANLLFQKAKKSDSLKSDDYLETDLASFFSVKTDTVYESNEDKLKNAFSLLEKKRKRNDDIVVENEFDSESDEVSDEEYLGDIKNLNDILSDEDDESNEEENDSVDNKEENIHENETEQEKKTRIRREQRREYRKKKSEEKRALLEERKKMTPKQVEDEKRRTIFVGNVPLDTNKDDFLKHFSNYGKIVTMRFRNIPLMHPGSKDNRKNSIIRKDFHPDRSSMSAYIVFEDRKFADASLKENGEIFNGKHIRVDLASNKPGRKKDDYVNSVYVSNLPFGTEEEELYQMFEKCGKIQSVRVIRDEFYKACKGFAYIKFETEKGFKKACELNEKMMYKDKNVHVTKAIERSKSKISRRKEIEDKGDQRKKKKFDPKQLEQKYKNKRRKMIKKK